MAISPDDASLLVDVSALRLGAPTPLEHLVHCIGRVLLLVEGSAGQATRPVYVGTMRLGKTRNRSTRIDRTQFGAPQRRL